MNFWKVKEKISRIIFEKLHTSFYASIKFQAHRELLSAFKLIFAKGPRCLGAHKGQNILRFLRTALFIT